MKKLLFSFAALLCMSAAAQAQNDVTRFLGIPIDGTKWEMIRQLKTKGFRNSASDSEVLEGEFNGRDVMLHVVTNNNKVYRIMVADANTEDERNIQIRFNNLCRQFENNQKYISLSEDQIIDDKEDISYQMTVKKMRYEAVFFQKPDDAVLREELRNKYSEEQLNNPSEEIINYALSIYQKRPVWFMIDQVSYGQYRILMYYDNACNQASGEDL